MISKEEIYKIISSNPVCNLATIEGDAPKVREIMMYKCEPDKIIFHTGKFKALHTQLQKNAKAEMCFTNGSHEAATMVQVRVSGEFELIEDNKLKEEIIEARPFLKALLKGPQYDELAVYKLKNAKAAIWNIALNHEPTTYIDI